MSSIFVFKGAGVLLSSFIAAVLCEGELDFSEYSLIIILVYNISKQPLYQIVITFHQVRAMAHQS